MPDALVGADSITISSPDLIASLSVSIDKGEKGDRGAKLFSNVGHPQQFTYQYGNTYTLYNDPANDLATGDIYWRIDTSRAYRLQSSPQGSLEWVELAGGVVIDNLGTTEINFYGAPYQKYVFEADSADAVTFTIINIQPGYSLELLIKNEDNVSKTLTFPPWTWVTPIPKILLSDQRILLTLKSFGETNPDIIASASTSTFLEAVV